MVGGTLVCDCVGMSSSPGLAIVSGVLALGAALAVGVGLSSVHWYTVESSLNDIDVGLTGFCQSSTISLLDPTGRLGFAVESCVSLVDQIHFLEHVNSVLGGASEALKQTRQLWYGSISAIVACSLAIIGYVVLLAAAAFCATSHFLGDPEASGVVGKRGAAVGLVAAILNALGVGIGWWVVGRVANHEMGETVEDIGWAAWVAFAASFLGLASAVCLFIHTRSSSQLSSTRLLPVSSRGSRYTTFGSRGTPDY